MKSLTVFIPLLFIISSCNKTSFKVGDCIQKPDEMTVWKVTTVDEKNDMGKLTQSGVSELVEKDTKLNSNWIITSCLAKK